MIFDGGGQVAGQNLRAIVVQGHGCALVGVAGDMVHVPADNAQGVGDHRRHMAVLLNVLRQGIAHQAPAPDVAHAGYIGKEIVTHHFLPIRYFIQPIVTRTGKHCNNEEK